MEKSRTEYSMKNASTAFVMKIITLVAGYLTRVVFARVLSSDYLGVNGLFLDVMNLFSLSELGFGTAITFALYRPIANGDIEKQKSLMRMYRTFYRIVALMVLTIGLCLLPFLDVMIRDQPQVEHITLIYLMYLTNSVLSYLLIYKKTLIDAHQRMYVGVYTQSLFLIAQYILQVILLVLTHNFILYLCIYLVCTLGNNICIAYIAGRDYPYLNDRNVHPLDSEEKKDIYKNIRSMLMHKMGTVVVNSTDNLLLSAIVGTFSVACYSNYFLLIGSIRQVLNQFFYGIMASVGNLGVKEDAKQIKEVFETAFFIDQWLFGIAAISLYEMLTPFVRLSFGTQYAFDNSIVLMLCVNFYVTGLRQASLVFRDSLGLFWYDRYKSIAEALINLIVSIILGLQLGTLGIFLGTFISTMTTSAWIEPLVLYRVRLKESPRGFYCKYLTGCLVTAVIWLMTDIVCHYTPEQNMILVLLLRGMICCIIPNALFAAFYHRSKGFKELVKLAARFLKNQPAFIGRKGGKTWRH